MDDRKQRLKEEVRKLTIETKRAADEVRKLRKVYYATNDERNLQKLMGARRQYEANRAKLGKVHRGYFRVIEKELRGKFGDVNPSTKD